MYKPLSQSTASVKKDTHDIVLARKDKFLNACLRRKLFRNAKKSDEIRRKKYITLYYPLKLYKECMCMILKYKESVCC